jgi:acylphosphatase
MAKLVYYSGDVQGVGFRATAVSIARRHPAVRGWVRNLADGRVELFADGHPSDVDAFLADVRERMTDHIETEDVAERDPDDTVSGFRIVG